ncbi:MAG: TonB-dependent receptor, plug [Cellvibrio sp.]|nr:TonB-dependent receptor, plug [Cellvibrio sp.]
MTKPSGITSRKKALVLAIGCALYGGQSYAQEPAVVTATDETVEEVIVMGVRGSQAKAIDLKRESANVVDSIVAEDIGKLPDTTITDSLQRVTGVQINREGGEGTTLNVRGMQQVLTTMNGEQFLSPWSITGVQANYSDIPASMISGVDVYKSQSANTLAGGISGVVDLKTLDPSTLDQGFTSRFRVEAGMGSQSKEEYGMDGTTEDRDPDHSLTAVLGFNNGDNFAILGNLYTSSSYAANYSMWEEHHLAFLDGEGGKPIGDLNNPYGEMPDPENPDQMVRDPNYQVNDWYLVPTEFGASSSFLERERDGGSITAKFDINDNWSVRGDVFYTQMDKYNRSVNAGFTGENTPDSFSVNNELALHGERIYDVLQPGTQVGEGHPFSYTDGNGALKTVNIHSIQKAEIWAADFQTTSSNEIEKTAALNTNFQVNYTNNENLEASMRILHAEAEKQYRKATFQQGTPAWLWVDEDDLPGKDPVDGYRVTVDYTGDYPSFSYVDDLSSADLLKQYQGFADGANTEAELNVVRADVKFNFDGDFIESLEGGLRYGVREADYNKFFYVSPTGRYTDWEDPRVPVDKRYKLLPGNLVWQKYPNWLKFNYAETNSSLIDIGGLEDNGFSAADTMAFSDFGPIKGFEKGIASLNPAAWDNPYEFLNRLYPGTRTVNDPGYTYSVEEASTSGFMQMNFGNDSTGLFGIPYRGNLGFQAVQTDRTVDQSVVPEVLDSFNSIGYDDWQKIAYVYETETFKNSNTEILPSFNLNLFPSDDVVTRFGVARTMTRNDLDQVGSSMSLWYGQCNKTDENGDPVMVPDPATGQERQDTVGCIGGGDDKGSPDIKPWLSTVYNASAEWYFAESSILGLGMFLIKVDTAVEEFQEARHFLDMDGIDRGRQANIYTTRNVGASDLYGLELGYKQPFTFLPGEFLSATGIEFNYTYSHSETDQKDIMGNALPLPSNSENQSNLILWYDKDGLNVRLAYNYRSEEFSKRTGVITNVAVMQMANWVEPVGYLDLSVNYWLNDNWNFFFSGTNLTEESRKSYAQFEDQFQSLWAQEARYTIGVNMSF